jgi:GntR family transcriptional repressor for pyruvate dehydrogenase complex
MKDNPGRVDVIMRALEGQLLDGTYGANARMPAERELAARHGVSRNTVREALQRMAARGLLRIRPGAGVFVTDQLRTGIASPWRQLVADHPAVRDDVLEFRRVLEGATAYFAAQRADEADRTRIRAELAALEAARGVNDKHAEAAADTRLHEAIALASHNSMFLHLHNSVIVMLREHITQSGNSLRSVHGNLAEDLLGQHRAIVEAICAGQPEAARGAMQGHIDFVSSRVGTQD